METRETIPAPPAPPTTLPIIICVIECPEPLSSCEHAPSKDGSLRTRWDTQDRKWNMLPTTLACVRKYYLFYHTWRDILSVLMFQRGLPWLLSRGDLREAEKRKRLAAQRWVANGRFQDHWSLTKSSRKLPELVTHPNWQWRHLDHLLISINSIVGFYESHTNK